MKEKELKHMSRAELLELLLVQTKETERLRARLKKAESELADRNLRIREAGDLAHAALELNGVMEAAQAAAQQYLENIARMEEETRQRCEQLLANAGREAAQLRNAEPEAEPEISDNALIQEIYELLDK